MQSKATPVEGKTEDIPTIWSESSKKNSAVTLSFLQKFTTDSTLHGIRYLFESESCPIRRILWLFVIIACTGFCTEQFYQRITKFISNPQTVDVEIVYTNKHDFPKVTICNNNLFKSTKVDPPELARLFSQFFKTNPEQSDSNFIQELEDMDKQILATTGSYWNLTQIYIDAAHDAKDLIYICRFRGRSCGPHNFTMIFTDYGPCYQFIGDGNPLIVTNAGTGTGLTLELNVEQYAYMSGPHYSAGVLVLIQDPVEIPMIEGKAIVAPVGGEVILGLDLTEVDLLPPPIGDCSNKDLQYFSHDMYSVSACKLECLTEYIVKKCGCKIGFMPGNAPLCRVPRYFACALPFSKNFTQSNEAENCSCPPACTDKSYTISFTFAPASDYSTKWVTQYLTSVHMYFSEFVQADGVFDYNFNQIQKNQDMMALQSFAPFLADLTSAALAVYSKLNAVKNLLAALNQTITAQSPALPGIAAWTQSVGILLENMTLLIQSVDPSYYCKKQNVNTSVTMNKQLQYFLAKGYRLWMFNEFRMDSLETNNATTLLFLQQSFIGSMQRIEQCVQTVLQLVASNGLAASSSAADTIAQSLSRSLVDWTSSNVIFERSLHNMVTVGLPAISQYSTENVPRLESVNYPSNFVRSNFIRIDIFFKEMRYQQIQKQLSDSVVGLICDLGGTFGLCLGASIMSIYEFLDFLICYIRMRTTA